MGIVLLILAGIVEEGLAIHKYIASSRNPIRRAKEIRYVLALSLFLFYL
ncbi:hypothetical protein M3226_28215 [Neobacillus cucumis]|nr:hypothetical protein [Neobacillus cucumis]MCM3729476.1 hypothetical protein [Neobacillus cucumis]